MSAMEPAGLHGNRQLRTLRRVCEFQLYALFFALPFEYYLRSREQTLFTSLKVQILLFIAAWMCLRLAGALDCGKAIWQELSRSLPGRLLFAIAMLVLAQVLAAALAPEFHENAIKAAVKFGLGAFLAIAAADLAVGYQPRSHDGGSLVCNSAAALSLSGALTATLGLGQSAGINFCAKIVHIFQTSEFLWGNRLRFVSTMEYPNTAGSLLAATLFASLALAIFRRPGRNGIWRALWLVVGGIQGLALGLTLSRGALGSTLVALLAAAWILRRPAGSGRKRTVMAACSVALLPAILVFYLARRGADGEGAPSGKRLARWELNTVEEIRYLLPDHTYLEKIVVENTSPFQWQDGDFGIGYRWYRLGEDQSLPLVAGATFTEAVAARQKLPIQVPLLTPCSEGEYLLILVVTCRNNGEIRELKGSYSPAKLCIVGPLGSFSKKSPTEKARRYLAAICKELGDPDAIIASGRPDLWLAAVRMFWQRPFLGMGPDNFRLLKWKYMDVPMKDERILANNLYLEMLSGSGIVGLASLLRLLWEFGRTLGAKVAAARSSLDLSAAYFGVAYLAAFALHGLVDYFLKFTPTFLLFWLALGILCAGGQETRQAHANRI